MDYQKHLELNRLQREAFTAADPLSRQEAVDALIQSAPEASVESAAQVVLKSKTTTGLLSAATTGLDATVTVKLPQIPTAVVHLLDPEQFPLVECTIINARAQKRRIRVTSFVEGYSAKAVNTMELNESGAQGFSQTFSQLPSFFPQATAQIREITRGMLNVLIDDLDTGKVEVHVSRLVWLLPPTSAPRSLRDPSGTRLKVNEFLGAFVTPNAEGVFEFLAGAVKRHPAHQFAGYQDAVEPQVRALYQSLQLDLNLRYVNSVIAFSMEGWASQRVRLPRETLLSKLANCIDGVVLFASLLESISLSAAIGIVDLGHSLVAWESRFEKADWTYLETTLIGSGASFEDALKSGKEQAAKFGATQPSSLDTLPLRVLRGERKIMPLE